MSGKIIKDHKLLIEPQATLLEQVRERIGPMVAASLSVKKGHGWYISIAIQRVISPSERIDVDEIIAKSDLPVIIEEMATPPRLVSARQGRLGQIQVAKPA